jgi:histidinol-phosphatase (PHP family)
VIVDYHMHLRDPDERIDHTVEGVERFVATAGARGIDEIGFTEHVYYFEQTKRFWTAQYQLERCVYDLDAYVGAVAGAKERGLPVKLGLEVDYVPGTEAEMAALFGRYPFDYLLGSIHYADGFPVDQRPGIVEKLGPGEGWRRYFVWLRNAARSGLFDSLAHPDLVKHNGGPRPDAESVQWLHEETADAIDAAGVCIEVSAAGLRKPVGELYPDGALLSGCRSRGVAITLASDAHVPQDVGRNLDRAIEHARAAGYETVSVFDGRKRREEPLG